MNIFAIDLTTDKHFISIKYDGVVTDFILMNLIAIREMIGVKK